MAGVALGTFALQSFFIWVSGYAVQSRSTAAAYETVRSTVETGVVTSILCIFICILIIVSNVFTPLKDKCKRIAFFILPTSNLERYLTALVFAILICPLCIIVAAFAGDLLRAFVFMLAGRGWDSGLEFVIPTIFSNDITTWSKVKEAVFSNLSVVWVGSCYILGASYLRRFNFATTSILLIAISATVSYVCIQVIMATGSTTSGNIMTSIDGLFWTFTITMVVFIVFNVWCSYQLFKRFQIITPKTTQV